ncbi:MAG TPA: UvrD-helicase domain-containing protein [Candidatus Kryptonia bacterium]
MVGLTERQREALELEKHISVTANAGSGKTRVLVERYVEAVGGGVDIENILCLTFTDKAALELRQKVIERISSEISVPGQKPGNSERARLLRRASRKMLEANISTIHSFCSQILREFPVEAGIDANFKVLEEFDAATLKEESCDEAIRSKLVEERTNTEEQDRKAHNFLVRIGYKKTMELLQLLLAGREKIEHLEIAKKPLLLDEDEIRKSWTGIASEVVKIVREFVDLARNDGFGDAVISLENAISVKNVGVAEILKPLSDLLEILLTKDGTVRKKVKMKSGVAGIPDSAAGLLDLAYSPFRKSSGGTVKTSPAEYLGMLKVMMQLYEVSASNYSRKKYAMGALDFDDLQIFMVRLLRSNEAVKEMLASRFSHIMVDEFQDTNFLQYDIFRSILRDFSGAAKLFVVGDPKQSIYRFRNAQVEVSRKTENDLVGLPDGKSVSLTESFRMNTGIASFVNEMFSGVMSSSGDYGIMPPRTGYDALVPKRTEGKADPVEIFIPEEYSSEDETEEAPERALALKADELQAAFTASRIRTMVDSKEKRKDVKSSEGLKEIKFGDVAILLRSRVRLALLEEALTRYRVPYIVSSGIGFYSSQEVYDLTAYLSFLLDNNSDISLLTVLRSPFFGISENELFEMSFCGGRTLLERLKSFAQSEKGTEETKYAVAVLDEEIDLAHRLTIPQLLDRILGRTGWLGAYLQSPTGGQRIANLRKLMGIAREFEGRGFNNLYDFVERIKYLKVNAREGQAAFEENVDAVKIMTVHAAKGLEFPVVFIPFCDSRTNRGDDLIINDNVGVLPVISGEFPPEMNIYRRLEDLSEQAETARLFYVACTRAMDKVVLTTKRRKSAPKPGIGCFGDIIAKRMDFSKIPGDSYYDLPGVRVKIQTGLPEVKVSVPRGKTATRRLGELFLGPVPAEIDGEMYSATLLQTFKLCPTKYFLRYLLGMPVPGAKAGSADDFDFSDTIKSTLKGEIIHEVLQLILSGGKSGDDAIKSASEISIKSRIAEEEGVGLDELVGTVSENVHNAIQTLGQIINGGEKFYEQTITRKFGSDFLTGTLDLLVKDEKGYHIYDYKTNRLDRPASEIFSDYDVQMKFYVTLCASLAPEQDEFDATIIFTREPGKYLTKKYTRTEIGEFEKEMEGMIREIKKIESPSGFIPGGLEKSLPVRTPHCQECDYYSGKSCLLGKGARG